VGPASRRPFARLLADEAGFGLIEVIVSALLLVLVASGVYLGLDAASATSGVNKHRSMATAIAQQDQDRMRAMAVGELSNYRDTLTSTVGPVTYTVRSSASWVTDDTGTASCASGQARAHYLRIASSVTWPNMHVDPVTVESVVAPPAGSFGTNLGSLAVQVRDRDGDGVPGVSVALTGVQSYVDLTNETGCVLWGYLPVGTYDVTITKEGYVDRDGVAQPRRQAGVVGEATSTVAFDYDLGGWIQADFQTLVDGVLTPASWHEFSLVSTHLALPWLSFESREGPQTAIRSRDAVYPFVDPYGVYAGRCAGADPVTHRQSPQLVVAEAGGTRTVAVRLPPIDLYVVSGGRPLEGATVRFTATGSGCSGTTTRATGADGTLTERGLPYGTYDVCVQATISSVTRRLTGSVANVVPTGVPVADATYDMTAAPAGTCA
jgi:Tfp pilus assembly protein PilV